MSVMKKAGKMVRTYLFQENVYPILIRELMDHEEAIELNDQKAINSILESVLINGSPLSEKKRSSLEFIKSNRDKILADIRLLRNDPEAAVHHPASATYPAKMRIIATALLSCEEHFRNKDFGNPDFRTMIKREVSELATKEGLRIRHLENYFVNYYDDLLKLVDEIKAESESPSSSVAKNFELKEEEMDAGEEGEMLVDEGRRLQVKIKKLSSQEVQEGGSIKLSGNYELTGVDLEELVIVTSSRDNLEINFEDHQEALKKAGGALSSEENGKFGDKRGEDDLNIADAGRGSENVEKLEAEDLEIRVKSLEINEWREGQLAWAPINDWIYWPCIVMRDANVNHYVTTENVGDRTITMIHVKYFGPMRLHKWVTKDSMIDCSDPDDLAKMTDIFNRAVDEFQQMMRKSIYDRIDAIGAKKKRVCSPSAASPQKPVKKIKLVEKF